jgi:hypothetical protein
MLQLLLYLLRRVLLLLQLFRTLQPRRHAGAPKERTFLEPPYLHFQIPFRLPSLSKTVLLLMYVFYNLLKKVLLLSVYTNL